MSAGPLSIPERILLGVIHLPPLPGSPRAAEGALERAIEKARTDAKTLLDADFDGYVIENFGDVPFFADRVPPHVLTSMTRIACELPRTSETFVAVNVLRNDARGALSVAAAVGAHAVRINVHAGAMVTDQGLVTGRAAETLRLRREIAPRVAILADVHVKHAAPLSPLETIEDAARDAAHRGLADALIVTGRATGSGASEEDFERVRSVISDRPILVGSGVTEESARAWYQRADGIIVGSALERERPGGSIDSELARTFVAACRRPRSNSRND